MQKCASEDAEMLSRRETGTECLVGEGNHLAVPTQCQKGHRLLLHGIKSLPKCYILLYLQRVQYPCFLPMGKKTQSCFFLGNLWQSRAKELVVFLSLWGGLYPFQMEWQQHRAQSAQGQWLQACTTMVAGQFIWPLQVIELLISVCLALSSFLPFCPVHHTQCTCLQMMPLNYVLQQK